jgi:CDP-glucose 4,6-dehydratase
MTVEEVVEKLIKKWGSGKWVTEMPNSKELHECRLLKLDISKAIYYLGWKPRLDFDKTLKLVVDWYKNENLDYSFDVQQIEEFLDN